MFDLNISSRSLARLSSERSKAYGLFDDIQIGSYIDLGDCLQLKCVLQNWDIIMDFPEISDMSLIRKINSMHSIVTKPSTVSLPYSSRLKIQKLQE